MSSHKDPIVTFSINDETLATIVQEHRGRGPVGTAHHDNTGWQVWECSNVMLRFILQKKKKEEACLHTFTSSVSLTKESVILDLSAGAGLVSIALAVGLGCKVVASDTTPQLPQLLRNVNRNKERLLRKGGEILVRPYYWGDDIRESPLRDITLLISSNTWLKEAEAVDEIDELKKSMLLNNNFVEGSSSTTTTNITSSASFPWFDLCVISDVLYIALRDGLAPQLRTTLRALVGGGSCRAVLFAFEERLIREEEAFMSALSGYDKIDGYTVDILELDSQYCRLEKEEALSNVGGLIAQETLAADLFWEPPPVRMFLFKRGEES